VNRLYFEEIKEGYSFTTSSKPITGTEIDMVAQLSGADLPGFLDNEFAQSWGFKARVAPGAYLILSMMGLLAKQGFLANAVWVTADGISWKNPVHPGDRIHVDCEVVGTKEMKRGGGLPLPAGPALQKKL
jgi:acyl dehydratase